METVFGLWNLRVLLQIEYNEKITLLTNRASQTGEAKNLACVVR